MTRNQLVSQIIQNTLEKTFESSPTSGEKKALALMERRSLKAEVIDLKALPLRNIVKKETNLKIS